MLEEDRSDEEIKKKKLKRISAKNSTWVFINDSEIQETKSNKCDLCHRNIENEI